jgi:hypothetical protein
VGLVVAGALAGAGLVAARAPRERVSALASGAPPRAVVEPGSASGALPAVRAPEKPLPPAPPTSKPKKPATAPIARAPTPPAPEAVPTPAVETAPMPVRAPSGVTIIETGKDRSSRPIDFDPKNFDAVGFLPEAQKLARQRMSDAVLVELSVEGVLNDGRVDLTLTRHFSADYFFRSPSLSTANPALSDDDQDLRCLFYVVVSAKEIETYTTTSIRGCHERPLPKISCPLPTAASAALAQGGVPGHVAKASWLKDGWYFNYGDELPSFTVRCP